MNRYVIGRWEKGDSLPRSGILVIRHGPREGGSFPSSDVRLTNRGRVECIDFGERWDSTPPLKILTSGIPRCIETATLIRQGAGWDVDVEVFPLLGSPGPFVTDMETVHLLMEMEKERDGEKVKEMLKEKEKDMVKDMVKEKEKKMDLGFLRRHIAGEAIPGMRSRDEGIRLLVSACSGHVSHSGVLLAISHDSIIAALLAHGGSDPDPWPEPLCGATLDV